MVIPLQILVDSSSSHNFVDVDLAKRLGCKLEPINLQSVTVADGNKLQCYYMCRNFRWRLQGTEFCSDIFLIPLGSCDVVLGV